jgi:hypothetical protein
VIKQELLEDFFADGSRRWQMPFADSSRIALHADAGVADEHRSYHLYRQISAFSGPGPWFAIIFLIGVALFYFWLL